MITWKVTEQQADQVLHAISQRPFAEVAGLIGELMKQAQEQQAQKQDQIPGLPQHANGGAPVLQAQ